MWGLNKGGGNLAPWADVALALSQPVWDDKLNVLASVILSSNPCTTTPVFIFPKSGWCYMLLSSFAIPCKCTSYSISIMVCNRCFGENAFCHILAIVFNWANTCISYNWLLCVIFYSWTSLQLVVYVTESVVTNLCHQFIFILLCDILAWRFRPNAGFLSCFYTSLCRRAFVVFVSLSSSLSLLLQSWWIVGHRRAFVIVVSLSSSSSLPLQSRWIVSHRRAFVVVVSLSSSLSLPLQSWWIVGHRRAFVVVVVGFGPNNEGGALDSFSPVPDASHQPFWLTETCLLFWSTSHFLFIL